MSQASEERNRKELLDRTRMEGALRERLESVLWDSQIASAVIAKSDRLAKTRDKKKKIAWFASPALTAAAVLVIVFFVRDYQEARIPELDQLIVTQINRTYYDVFNEGLENASNGNGNADVQGIYDDSIDELIDSVLANR